jgi:nitrite reductase/ring-hydroxylating ferredoxin subunit
MKIKVCLESELPSGSMMSFDVLGRTVLFANIDGSYHAIDGLCSHGMGSLARGILEGYVVRCPLHGAEFDLRTGKVLKMPWKEPIKAFDLRAYEVSVEDGCLIVDYYI